MASFKEEFEKARKEGKKTFTWKGNSYTTKTKEENKPKDSIGEPVIEHVIGQAKKDLNLDLKITSGDRDLEDNKKSGGRSKSQHLVKGSARDISIKNLKDKDIKRVKEYLIKRGFTSIDETEATHGTGKHLHFDSRPKQIVRKMEKSLFGKVKTVPDKEAEEVIAAAKKAGEERAKTALPGELRRSDEEMMKKVPLKQKLQEAIKQPEKKQEPELKGMSRSLKDSLSLVAEAKSPEQVQAALDLNKNIGKQIEEAPKVAMVKQESDGAFMRPEEEEIKKKTEAALKEMTPSVVERTIKEEAPTQKVAEKQVLENQEQAIQKIQNPELPKKPAGSVSDQFKEALSFFAPTMIGALGGALFEGTEGAVAGAEAGTSLGESFRNFQLKKAQLEQKAVPSVMEQERLKVSKGNLEIRKKEIEQQASRAKDLDAERGLRREERDLDRAVKFKQDFSARSEVKKFVENLNDLEDIKTMAVEGKKLPEAIQAKIARSISGEVGVLTDNDIKRSQINPDIKSTINRKIKLWTEGELPQSDIDELLKVAAAIKAKKQERLRESAIGFASSRDKHISDEGIRKRFLEDILAENGLKESTPTKPSRIPSDEEIENMSIEQLREAGLL